MCQEECVSLRGVDKPHPSPRKPPVLFRNGKRQVDAEKATAHCPVESVFQDNCDEAEAPHGVRGGSHESCKVLEARDQDYRCVSCS